MARQEDAEAIRDTLEEEKAEEEGDAPKDEADTKTLGRTGGSIPSYLVGDTPCSTGAGTGRRRCMEVRERRSNRRRWR